MSENYEDGSVYTGEFKVGMRHGKGIFVYSDGGTYEGEWKNGQMDGFGVLFYPNKQKAYEGGWLNDKFHGSGVIFNENIEIDEHIHIDYKDFETIGENWIKYEGFFQGDNKNGMGILFLKDGSRFEGNFVNDCIDGNGRFFWKNGKFFDGEWMNNKLIRVA